MVTMSPKSSVAQATSFVSQVLMSDRSQVNHYAQTELTAEGDTPIGLQSRLEHCDAPGLAP